MAFAVGLSPAPMVKFPAPSLKFRTSGFPQSGFKPRCANQPRPSREASEIKRQVRIPSVAPRFDMAFVACAPSCVFDWYSQPARLALCVNVGETSAPHEFSVEGGEAMRDEHG